MDKLKLDLLRSLTDNHEYVHYLHVKFKNNINILIKQSVKQNKIKYLHVSTSFFPMTFDHLN